MSDTINLDLIGYPLDDAKKELQARGLDVYAVEIRSLKGVDGGVPRVIRQRKLSSETVEICYAYMRCEPQSEDI